MEDGQTRKALAMAVMPTAPWAGRVSGGDGPWAPGAAAASSSRSPSPPPPPRSTAEDRQGGGTGWRYQGGGIHRMCSPRGWRRGTIPYGGLACYWCAHEWNCMGVANGIERPALFLSASPPPTPSPRTRAFLDAPRGGPAAKRGAAEKGCWLAHPTLPHRPLIKSAHPREVGGGGGSPGAGTKGGRRAPNCWLGWTLSPQGVGCPSP